MSGRVAYGGVGITAVIYMETRHPPGLRFSLLLLTLGVSLFAMLAGRLGMLLRRG
jgi:hypothetical protein